MDGVNGQEAIAFEAQVERLAEGENGHDTDRYVLISAKAFVESDLAVWRGRKGGRLEDGGGVIA